MLRAVLIALSGLAFAGTLTASCFAHAALWGPAIISGIVFAGMLFENYRYQRLGTGSPGPQWQATGERFLDPQTGEVVTVWFNPETGERRYAS